MKEAEGVKEEAVEVIEEATDKAMASVVDLAEIATALEAALLPKEAVGVDLLEAVVADLPEAAEALADATVDVMMDATVDAMVDAMTDAMPETMPEAMAETMVEAMADAMTEAVATEEAVGIGEAKAMPATALSQLPYPIVIITINVSFFLFQV